MTGEKPKSRIVFLVALVVAVLVGIAYARYIAGDPSLEYLWP